MATKVSEIAKAAKNQPSKKSEGVLTKAQAEKLEQGFLNDLSLADSSLISAAIKLNKFIEGEGWIPLGFMGLTAWRIARVPMSEFYNLRSINKLLDAGVQPETVERMRLTNINALVKNLPESSWKSQSWQKKAIDMPVDQFEKQVRAEADDLGTLVEEVHRRGFIGPASLVNKWDLSLKVAESIDGAKTMEDRVEAIVADYLNGPSGVAGKNRLQRYEEVSKGEL